MIGFPQNTLLDALTAYFLERLEDKAIERQLPLQWSHMHLFSSVQVARILGMKRKLDDRLSVMCVALHDVATIVDGVRENHGIAGALMLPEVLSHVYRVSPDLDRLGIAELDIIESAVRNHSDKSISTDRVYDEFTKDVDAFDRYLHGLDTEESARFRIFRVAQELSLAIGASNGTGDGRG